MIKILQIINIGWRLKTIKPSEYSAIPTFFFLSSFFFLLFSFFFLLPSSRSQPFPHGNEWINYNQKYLEFKIIDTGIYRISYSVLSQGLSNIGESIGSVDPRKIQIFGRGEEQYIYIEGENDSSFDADDFIEFYATKNDGWLDAQLYVSTSDQSNPFYSLFNDTATYFLTISTDNGKRMGLVNFSGSSTTPATYFFKEEVISFTANFYQGEFLGSANGPAHSLYKAGKGWFSTSINSNNNPSSLSAFINTAYAYKNPGAPEARAAIVLTGTNSKAHNLKITYGISDTTDSFNGYLLRKYNFSIPAADLTSPNTTFKIASISQPDPQNPDLTAVSHFYLKYPHSPTLTGISETMMIFPPSAADSTYILFNSYPSNKKAYIYDLTSHKRLETKQSIGNTLEVVIPPSVSDRMCYLFPDSQISFITALYRVTPDGKFTDYSSSSYKEMDSAFVIISHSSLTDGATAYKNYRDDLSHDALAADIDELYDQFSYGINKHPLAIKNFCRFLLDTFTVPPQHLFLIGKAISDAAFSTRNTPSFYAQNLVPTFGWPGSDVAFTSGLNGTQAEPAIPTGRLAAKTKEEVNNYLNKVILFEQNLQESEVTQKSIPGKIWMKHAIHFCGGNTAEEGDQFCGYLEEYEKTLESDLYGGFVTTVSKNSTDPIQVNLTDSIKNIIEKGVSILTFFGHSSSSYIDVSIGYASDYDILPGRYPLMIANGCFSGDIFTPGSLSISEDFVLAKGKGAIGYIAHTGLGYAGELHKYTNSLYNNISKKSYGKTLGECIRQGIADNQPTGFIEVATALGMTLHGDPAVKVNTHAKPDYAIAPAYIYFTPGDVTTADTSFNINIVIANLGMATTDSVSVYLERTLPNDSAVIYTRIIPPVFYKDTVMFTLPVDLVNGPGLNQFYIHVDENYLIPEISDLNNYTGGNNEVTLMIKSGDLIPVYPYNYAVLPDRKIVLKASTSDPFASPKEYIFQVDTTDAYNSQMMRQYTVSSVGGVVKWNIDTNYFNLPDSTVFYWRTSPNTPSDYRWREHSFQVISGKNGWGQKHFYQFKNDSYSGIEYDRDNLEFKFKPQQKGLRCDLWGHPGLNATKLDQTQYLINNAQQDYNTGTYDAPAMYIAIIDKCTLIPWGTKRLYNGVMYNPDNDFGNCNGFNLTQTCGRTWKVELYFIFRITNPVQMDSMRNLLNNKIPEGSYVLAYCFGSPLFHDTTYWKDSHRQALSDLGADDFYSVPYSDTVPYIFFGQKGNKAAAQEEIGISYYDFISLSAGMVGCTGNGTITTPVIGPGTKWGSLHWKLIPANAEDTVRIEVLNAASGNAIKNYSSYSGNVIPLDTAVSATSYPYLKLRADIEDDSLFTPAQLSSWYVLYDEIPEAALNPQRAFAFHASSLQQGDDLRFNVAIENVSQADMDSLRIRYWIEDVSHNIFSDTVKKNALLLAGKIMFDTVSFPTRSLSGEYRFWIEANPADSLWQLEQYHFNNIASIGFISEKDNINPLLDVSFDGIRILNGDIVSPKPEIVIQLKDENKFLALEDTSGFKIFITDPDKNSQRIYFMQNGSEQMRFSKAVLPENKCKIEYRPVFSKDGIYELRVQGNDASGNNAGDLDYSISFEVINKSTITEILNYPNPFSTSTRFVFTLTGAEIPDYFKIQILTVTGKVIREITRDELGPIHIGRNITDYAWNGTDEYGDPLANGVYLYRVTVKINGENMEHRESNADSFFKKGFGKMYLMR